jgi:serine/threonine-protein kinase ULK2
MATRIVHYQTEEGHTAEFYLHKKIGEGCFGEVYVTYLTDCHPKLAQILPKVLACKRIRLRSHGEIEEIKEREIKLSNSVNTNNTIRLYCVVKIKKYVYFFFHFYNGGTLTKWIAAKEDIPEKLCAQIITQLLKGLVDLSLKNFVHRDLKPENILMHFPCLTPDSSMTERFYQDWDYRVHNWFTVIIADLGMGKEEGFRMTKEVGTPLYRAPEVNSREDYDSKADVLSVGIIWYELLFGEPLFTPTKAKTPEGLQDLWRDTVDYPLERLVSYEAMQFLQYSLQKYPNDRLYAEELMELDFIQNAFKATEYTMPPAGSTYELSIAGQKELF